MTAARCNRSAVCRSLRLAPLRFSFRLNAGSSQTEILLDQLGHAPRKSCRISSLVRCFRPHLRNISLFFDWLAPKNAGVIGK